MRTSGNTVLITGGSAGIGLATARVFSAAGNTVIICGRDEDRLRQAKMSLPALYTIRCDLTREEEIERLVATVRRDFPALSILVNNAGAADADDFLTGNGSRQWIEDEVRINLIAPLTLTHLLLPILQSQGSAAIVIMSSGLALTPFARAPVYSATKAALHSFSRALRYRLRGTSVKVVEVLPPWVDTDLARAVDVPKISPTTVAQAILHGVKHDRSEVRVGQVKALYALGRLAPSLAERLVNKPIAG